MLILIVNFVLQWLFWCCLFDEILKETEVMYILILWPLAYVSLPLILVQQIFTLLGNTCLPISKVLDCELCYISFIFKDNYFAGVVDEFNNSFFFAWQIYRSNLERANHFRMSLHKSTTRDYKKINFKEVMYTHFMTCIYSPTLKFCLLDTLGEWNHSGSLRCINFQI